MVLCVGLQPDKNKFNMNRVCRHMEEAGNVFTANLDRNGHAIAVRFESHMTRQEKMSCAP